MEHRPLPRGVQSPPPARGSSLSSSGSAELLRGDGAGSPELRPRGACWDLWARALLLLLPVNPSEPHPPVPAAHWPSRPHSAGPACLRWSHFTGRQAVTHLVIALRSTPRPALTEHLVTGSRPACGEVPQEPCAAFYLVTALGETPPHRRTHLQPPGWCPPRACWEWGA